MNKIEGIILDWAGTTVDFGCFAPVNVFIEIFSEIGIDVTMAEAREPMGMLKWDHIATMLKMDRIAGQWFEKFGREHDDRDVDKLYEMFEPMLMKSLSSYCQPIPGVVSALKELREMGLKIGSTTGYTDEMLEVVRKGAKDMGYAPDSWVTPDSTGSVGRPYPYLIFRNMEELKLSACHGVIKVGDTKADILEGINAGVWSVGVIVGSSEMGLSIEEFEGLSKEEKQKVIEETRLKMESYGANFTIETLAELPALVEKINESLKEGRRPIIK